jgi:hypothetical protein
VRPWQDEDKSGAGVLRRFLPPSEGGADTTQPLARSRLGQFTLGLVPWQAMPEFFRDESRFPTSAPLGQLVRGFFAQPFRQIAMEPHHVRDELLRGHYPKAVPKLIEMMEHIRFAQNRMSLEEKNPELGKEIKTWLDRAFEVYARQQRATSPQEAAELNQQIDTLWREARAVTILLDGTRAWPLRLDALFLFALCKHEQAERLQYRSDSSPDDKALARRSVDAWKEVVLAWQQYLDAYHGFRFVNRTGSDASQLAANAAAAAYRLAGSAPVAAARMLGRAQLLSGDRDGAVQTWRQEVATSDLEKVGTLYLAKKAEK